MANAASDAVFAQLRLGAQFDGKRWKKHIDMFDEASAAAARRGEELQREAEEAAAAADAAWAAMDADDAEEEQEGSEGEGEASEHSGSEDDSGSESGSGSEEEGEDAVGQRAKKRKLRHGAAAGDEEGEEQGSEGQGIQLFKGQREQRGAAGLASPAAAFVDHEPQVHTKDPFEEANVIRKAHRIKVSGSAPPPPLRSFAELDGRPGCCRRLLSNLVEAGFTEPTPIQRQAATALLAGRELLAIAPTGSGKTLAFLLPLCMRLRALREAAEEAAEEGEGEEGEEREAELEAEAEGLKAVVVSPTKELSVQTARVLKLLLPGLRIRCSVLTKATAAGTDFSKVDVLLAQPLRLGAMAEEGRIDLSHVRLLVLDEADKLFDMGFTEQIDSVIAACKHRACVRALFSATLPEAVEGLARSVLKDPLRITVGERNTAAASVKQRLLFVGREEGKLLALRQIISEGLRPPVLVFVATKERAKELHRELLFDGVRVDSIHADQSTAARQAAVDNFRIGETWMLVATDLIGRGMDFLGVNTVVNFDCPRSTTDYIHRVGRTGRAGREGNAITFFTEDDAGQLRGIAHIIKAAGGDVPDWMLQLKKERRHRKAKAPAAGGISTEPVAEGERKKKAQWRQKGKGRGGPTREQQGGGRGGGPAGQQRQQQKDGGGGGKGQKRPAQQQQQQAKQQAKQQKPKQQQQKGSKPPRKQKA